MHFIKHKNLHGEMLRGFPAMRNSKWCSKQTKNGLAMARNHLAQSPQSAAMTDNSGVTLSRLNISSNT